MGRRKQQPASVHRNAIADAAQALFMERGMEAVSMDDIARASGYSKATLYVYFKNRDEIVRVLVLKSMQKLHDYLEDGLGTEGTAEERYRSVCHALTRYEHEYPYYFGMVLDEIKIDAEPEFHDGDTAKTRTQVDLDERAIYLTGEHINEMLVQFLTEGVKAGDLRADLKPLPTVFAFWGMLSGFICMADKKDAYIGMSMGMSRQEFLEYGFSMLYRAISNPKKGGATHA
ncbi:TetR/AcrR family transcriptional regulator [Clostridium sp. AN503]|uniref:TetR/AcrR family transcriptional regulator n=1 Tax=Clostridium sp. AN503 TaxID=3160598 RepID=UPI00345A899D